MKYRKKPVVIDAWPWPEYPDEAPIDRTWAGLRDNPSYQVILTLEGTMSRTEGDWLIRGTAGEYYPCKPDIFEKTYEAVDRIRKDA
jgi:hypothetical protein